MLANSGAGLRTAFSKTVETIELGYPDDIGLKGSLSVLETQNEELRLSVRKTETLMRETNHRAKNNLQVVASLLQMQAELLKDKDAVAALKATQHRVFSMAMIHERLCADSRIDRIDFEEYTQALLKELFDSYVGRAGRLRYCLNSSKVFLRIDQAIPCGLILNELVTNALKYAYPGDQKGDVIVDLDESADGTVTFSVSDQGVGLPDGFDPSHSSSMGLPIIELLVKEIGGKLSAQVRPGTVFKVEFQRIP